MKKTVYILTITFGLAFYNSRAQESNDSKSKVISSDTITKKQFEVKDSIYKIGEFLFEAKRNAKFEFIKKGEKSKIKTKGDTLYFDNYIVLLGDIDEITSPGIFKKFKFNSQFENFKTNKIYKGKLADPIFSTDKSAKRFITRIKDGCKKTGVNFAGHYTIIEWGCGAACAQMAIVDRISGEIIYSKIPFDKNDGHCGAEYKIDSRLLIINTEALSEWWGYESGYKRCDHWRMTSVFEIENNKLIKIE
ncbi:MULTISPECIES: hypothetical protein [unclassified Flavobacterium]|uniref:hypothetical protein n=1 Tax=unclassified Flavobacterium TaxID=196869 RepID=UPI0036144932